MVAGVKTLTEPSPTPVRPCAPRTEPVPLMRTTAPRRVPGALGWKDTESVQEEGAAKVVPTPQVPGELRVKSAFDSPWVTTRTSERTPPLGIVTVTGVVELLEFTGNEPNFWVAANTGTSDPSVRSTSRAVARREGSVLIGEALKTKRSRGEGALAVRIGFVKGLLWKYLHFTMQHGGRERYDTDGEASWRARRRAGCTAAMFRSRKDGSSL